MKRPLWMKRALFGVLGLALVAGLAWAAGPVKQPVRWSFLGGISVGNSAGSDSAPNRITNAPTADIDYDFASATITCVDTPAFPAPGVKKSDPCFVGNGPRDGGVQIALTANANFSATSNADNTVILRFCPAGTAANPVDAGYVVRCISNL